MRRITSTRPSAAAILALIALFVALGGSSYAAVTATITGKQVRNGSLTGKDIKNNSVTGADVKESRLGQVPSALKAGQASTAGRADSAGSSDKALQADHAAKSDSATTSDTATAVGPGGVDSAAIKSGAVTASKLGPVIKRSIDITVPAGKSEYRSISCANGEQALSGGTFWNDVSLADASAAKLHVVYSVGTDNSWQARGYNGTSDDDAKLQVSVMCLQ